MLKNKKTTLVWIAIALSCSVIVGGAIWYQMNVISVSLETDSLRQENAQLKKNIEDLRLEAEVNIDKEEYNADSDEKADWISYTDEDFGFSFSYPPEFVMSEDGAFDSLDVVGSKFGMRFETVIISSESGTQKARLRLLVDPPGFGPFFPNAHIEVFEAYDGSLHVGQMFEDVKNAEEKELFSVTNFNARNGHNYQLFISYDRGDTDYALVFREILSTFKFNQEHASNYINVYKNWSTGFNVTVPGIWDGYTVLENDRAVAFGIPEDNSLVLIYSYDKSDWNYWMEVAEKSQSSDELYMDNPSMQKQYITENNEYVYVYYATKYPKTERGKELLNHVDELIAGFELVE